MTNDTTPDRPPLTLVREPKKAWGSGVTLLPTKSTRDVVSRTMGHRDVDLQQPAPGADTARRAEGLAAYVRQQHEDGKAPVAACITRPERRLLRGVYQRPSSLFAHGVEFFAVNASFQCVASAHVAPSGRADYTAHPHGDHDAAHYGAAAVMAAAMWDVLEKGWPETTVTLQRGVYHLPMATLEDRGGFIAVNSKGEEIAHAMPEVPEDHATCRRNCRKCHEAMQGRPVRGLWELLDTVDPVATPRRNVYEGGTAAKWQREKGWTLRYPGDVEGPHKVATARGALRLVTVEG